MHPSRSSPQIEVPTVSEVIAGWAARVVPSSPGFPRRWVGEACPLVPRCRTSERFARCFGYPIKLKAGYCGSDLPDPDFLDKLTTVEMAPEQDDQALAAEATG